MPLNPSEVAMSEIDEFGDTVLDLSSPFGSLSEDAEALDGDGDPDDNTDLVWWLAQLAIDDRDRYLQLRQIAWCLVAENTERSVIPN